MTKQQICAGYQKLVRELYPRAIVMPSRNRWNPYMDENYNVFFIPDNAVVEYLKQWLDGDWSERAEKLGLPEVTLLPVYDSEVEKHFSDSFPELFNKNKAASAKTQKSGLATKRAKATSSNVRTLTSKN
jgi:hypothetical protein